MRIRWDPTAIRVTVPEMIRKLREGEPSIEVRPSTAEGLEMGVWMLKPGDAETVARRVRDILKRA